MEKTEPLMKRFVLCFRAIWLIECSVTIGQTSFAVSSSDFRVSLQGVTIPSQRRYVEYYAKMKNLSLQYEKTRLLLKGIYFENIPFNTINGSAVFTVYCGNSKCDFEVAIRDDTSNATVFYHSWTPLILGPVTERKKHVNMGDLRNKGSQWTYVATESIEVAGDVHIEFYLSKIISGVKVSSFPQFS